jgi:hypothetical protein
VLNLPAPRNIVSKLIPPLSTFRSRRPIQVEKPRLQLIDLGVCQHYRPPPATLL